MLAKAPAHPTSPQADPPLSRASSAPTGICGERRPPDHPGPPVGASLLAKTAAHSTSMQADPPLSRASSLPQWIAGALSIRIQHQTLWERACSRRRRHIQHHHKLTHHYREQAQLPQGFVANAGPLITPAPLWERACSRRRRHIQHLCKLTHRYREQARSHKELRLPTASGFNTKPCDSYSSTGVGQPRQRVRDGLRALCGAFGGAA